MFSWRPGVFLFLLSAAGCDHSLAPVNSSGASLEAARDALTEGAAGTALAIARGVLASQPHNVAALSAAGDAEAALGDRLAATISYKQACKILPHDVRARLGQGKLQMRDDVHGAEATFRAVVNDAPRDVSPLNDLGYVLDNQDRHAEAQVYYLAAQAVDPDRLSTRVNLALSLALNGQPERAEQMLRDMAASASTSRKIRMDLAVAQVMAGHDDDAAQTLSVDLSTAETKATIASMARLKQQKPPRL